MLTKPEVLAPAGTLEKLKIAIDYGADAVYIGGEAYGLRSRAGNFSFEEMAEGVKYAHSRGAKVHVAANMVTHEGDEEGAGDFFRTIHAIGIDAVIISDPALIEICQEFAPNLAIHLSTQASTTNAETIKFWQKQGVERVVLAREVSLDEIKQIRSDVSIELEAFVHGAMCISYSGRCTLSNHMSLRDANRGGCSQSCRWRYDLFEIDTENSRNSVVEDSKTNEPFSMSAVDLSMAREIPALIKAGVNSFKIEGRMKTIHYVSTVTNVYRAIVDSYMENPEEFIFKQEWEDELWKVAQRELSTGFYLHSPGVEEQLFGKRRKLPVFSFIGEVMDYNDETKIATIRQRNHFSVGDEIEFYGPGFKHFKQTVSHLWNEEGETIQRAPNPMMLITMPVDQPVSVGDMLRQKKEET